MGLFDRLFRRDLPQVTPPMSDALLRAIFTGEPITREKALTLPAVAGAVDFVTNCVASMPVKLYRIVKGKVEEVRNDPRVRLLNNDTGDTLDPYQWKKAMTADYLLSKGGYAYIRRYRNEVTGLFYVRSDQVGIIRPSAPVVKKDYTINVIGDVYQPWEFIKLLRDTKDGAEGVGVVEEVRKAIEAQYRTLIYQLGLVSAGGAKKGFLKSTRTLGQAEIDVLKAAWKNLYANNGENVVVLNNGLEFQEASASSVEMQLNESKRTFEGEIQAIFHIHPTDFNLTFKEAIYPIVKAFETALNRDLLLEKEKQKMFFEFDPKEILRTSITERYAAYKTAKETGFMTLNEIRQAENMNYVEGLDVVNVGLGAVLYDVNTHTYYTPNTDTTATPGDGTTPDVPEGEDPTQEQIQKVLIDKELDTEYEQSGNSANA